MKTTARFEISSHIPGPMRLTMAVCSALLAISAVLSEGGIDRFDTARGHIALSSLAQDLDEVVLYASEATARAGGWTAVSDSAAAGGARMHHPDAGAQKRTAPLANPIHYFELQFEAAAGIAYHLWIRGKAQNDFWGNDSVFVQFSGSLTQSGSPVFRIGTTSATEINLEDCFGCGLSGWGWQDNGWGVGVRGPHIYFQSSGTQTIRVQTREDGLSIDQIVLSSSDYLTGAPGSTKNDATILPKTGSSVPPPSVTLVRHPYLQQVTSSSSIIVWATREPGPAELHYWRGGGSADTAQATTTFFPASTTGMSFDYYQHEARLANLSAATSYNYEIFVNGIDATPGLTDRFVTAPVAGAGSVRFIAFGDSGIGSTEQRQLAALMAGDTFDLALHGGDVVYGTSNTTGGAHYLQYHDRFFDIYKNWLRSRPVFPSIGNHDNVISNGRAYRDLFVLPENGASAVFPDHRERYYSFNYGPVHFVALDTELAFQDTARRREQLDWLEADLAATAQPWKVAYFHRSPYSAGGEHGSDLAVRQAFGPVFEQYGVQLAISAHEHTYERTVPWREGPATNQGVIYIVSGGGGARLYPAGQMQWTAASRSAYHYLRGMVSGCQLTIQAIGLGGSVLDQYSFDRCAQSGDSQPPSVSIASPAAGATLSGTVTVHIDAADD
ncbi:MAG TPA: metallophosphoesterase family protein, partial [Blastocatellia bacterium]|nr:metallophosphoesterase family protein [Blastocatellia bacterium]